MAWDSTTSFLLSIILLMKLMNRFFKDFTICIVLDNKAENYTNLCYTGGVTKRPVFEKLLSVKYMVN